MNNRYWMIGLLVILAVICSSALAWVNAFTAPIIQQQEALASMRTVLDVFGIAYDPASEQSAMQTYAARIEEGTWAGGRKFTDSGTGDTAIEISGGGFQGPISLVVSLNGETISGFKVLSQHETPGLGARITEAGFQQSFIGKTVAGGIGMVQSGSAGPAQFDAITGATETSKAIQKMLDRAFKRYYGTGASS